MRDTFKGYPGDESVPHLLMFARCRRSQTYVMFAYFSNENPLGYYRSSANANRLPNTSQPFYEENPMKKQFASLLILSLMLALSAVSLSAATKKSTIKIDGMKCSKCSGSVAKALKATDGVESVEISVEKKEAVIQYDDEKVTEAKLREVINSTGFTAQPPTE